MMPLAVTGVGAVTCLGVGADASWARLCAGVSGIRFLRDPPAGLRTDVAGWVQDTGANELLEPRDAYVHGRSTHMAVTATAEAVDQAGLDAVPGHRVACLVSTGQGATDVYAEQLKRCFDRGPRAVSPYTIPAVMQNAPVAVLGRRHGWTGPAFNIAAACATGGFSVATGAMMLSLGLVDVVVVGSTEASLDAATLAGFGNTRALASAVDGDPSRASRPLAADRRGFVAAEGAGVLVLERLEHAERRGARCLALLQGWGASSDAADLTRPDGTGAQLRVAVEQALGSAELTPECIDHIHPHATATPVGDAAEVAALRAVFGDRLARIPLVLSKALIGHALGAAAAIELVVCVLALAHQHLHPAPERRTDPSLGALDVVTGEGRSAAMKHVLKTSAGFGGHNIALILGAP